MKAFWIQNGATVAAQDLKANGIDYEKLDVNNYQADLGGNKLPRSSALTLNYALSQLIFSEIGSFNWMIQGQTRTTHYMSVFNGNGKRLSEPAPGVTPMSDAYNALVADPRRLNDEVPTYTRFDAGVGCTVPFSSSPSKVPPATVAMRRWP